MVSPPLVITALIVLTLIIVVVYYVGDGSKTSTTSSSGQNNTPGVTDWPPTEYRVNMVNKSGVPLFFGALGPTPISPENNKSWLVNHGDSISLKLPDSWLNTAPGPDGKPTGKNGPRFWARTGCAWDENMKQIQCETGDCGGAYDCPTAGPKNRGLAGKAPVSLAEFCFKCGDGLTYYDVSLVDGYNISIDITPDQPYTTYRPGFQPTTKDELWCKTGLCKTKIDMRDIAPADFKLLRKELISYNPGDKTLSGDDAIAVFSNCGKYEYPVAPLPHCTDATDPNCSKWRTYCCQDPSSYGKPCNDDKDCTFGGACWKGTCQCRAYWSGDSCDTTNVCTNPDQQPVPTKGEPNIIGDDKMHTVCPRAYTWPNDPQTYSCNATSYTITFSPGGPPSNQTFAPPKKIIKCEDLDPEFFDYNKANTYCQGPRKTQNPTYACAKLKTTNQLWDCNIDNSGCNGVLCAWGDSPIPPAPAPPTPPTPPTPAQCSGCYAKCAELSPDYYDYTKANTDCKLSKGTLACAQQKTASNPTWGCNIDNVGGSQCQGTPCYW